MYRKKRKHNATCVRTLGTNIPFIFRLSLNPCNVFFNPFKFTVTLWYTLWWPHRFFHLSEWWDGIKEPLLERLYIIYESPTDRNTSGSPEIRTPVLWCKKRNVTIRATTLINSYKYSSTRIEREVLVSNKTVPKKKKSEPFNI